MFGGIELTYSGALKNTSHLGQKDARDKRARGNGGMPQHAERPQTRGRSVIRNCPDWFLRYRGGFIGGGISMGAAGFSGDSTGSDMLLGATGFSMYFFGSPSNVSLHALLQNP